MGLMAFKGSICRQQVGWSWEATDSFSSSPKAHYTRSNNDVIYYLHRWSSRAVLLEPRSIVPYGEFQ